MGSRQEPMELVEPMGPMEPVALLLKIWHWQAPCITGSFQLCTWLQQHQIDKRNVELWFYLFILVACSCFHRILCKFWLRWPFLFGIREFALNPQSCPNLYAQCTPLSRRWHWNSLVEWTQKKWRSCDVQHVARWCLTTWGAHDVSSRGCSGNFAAS